MRVFFYRVITILIAVEAFLSFPCFAASQQIDVTLTPSFTSSLTHLNVKVSFTGEEKGETIIDFPDKWAGLDQGKLLKNIIITTHGQELLLKDTEIKHQKKVLHLPGAPLELCYEVYSHPEENIHSTIIKDHLIYGPGYGLFACPLVDKGEFRITWHGLPSSWHTLCSYGTDKQVTFRGDMGDLHHTLYLATSSPFHCFEVEGKPIYVFKEGKFSTPVQQLIDELKIIVTSQRHFFNDYDFKFYFFSLFSTQDPRNAGGTALKNCFSAYFPKTFPKKDYLILLSHEHFHCWVGNKIPIRTLNAEVYWWSEGFTEYYCRLLLFREGLLTLEEFGEEINKLLISYYISPVRNEFNEKIKQSYWEDQNIQKLPYFRGFVFALFLDKIIREKTKQEYNLDEVMKRLFIDTQETSQEFSPALFKKIIYQLTQEDIDRHLTTYIKEGQTINLTELYSSLPLKLQDIYPFYLGFSLEDLVSKKVITQLDEKSAAYKAGLRENDIVESRDLIHIGDSQQTIQMIIKGKAYKFKPQGKVPYFIPQLDYSTEENKKNIRDWFSIKKNLT